MNDKKECCKECVFYKKSHVEGDMVCKRYPPFPHLQERSTYQILQPKVTEDDWCGEFQDYASQYINIG